MTIIAHRNQLGTMTVSISNVTLKSIRTVDVIGLNINISYCDVESLHFTIQNEPSSHNMVENAKITIRNSSLGSLDLQSGTEAVITGCNTDGRVKRNKALISAVNSNIQMKGCEFRNVENRNGPTILNATYNTTVRMINTSMIRNRGLSGTMMLKNKCSLNMTNVKIIENIGYENGYSAVSICDKTQGIIQNSILINNAAFHGGAIWVSDNSVLQCSNTLFESNMAINGGAIAITRNAFLTITNSTFNQNRAMSRGRLEANYFVETMPLFSEFLFQIKRRPWKIAGGGEGGEGGGITAINSCRVTLVDTRFLHNYGERYGGAIYALTNIDLSLSRSVFETNSPGGIFTSDNVSLKINGSTFSDHKSFEESLLEAESQLHTSLGGCVNAFNHATVEINNSSFSNNFASEGSSLLVHTNSSLKIYDSSFTNNSATKYGTVVVSGNVTVTMYGCLFHNNSGTKGAAFTASNHVKVFVQESKFIENSGAIFGSHYVNFRVNCTRFRNNSAMEGGAVEATGNVDLTIRNTQFHGNVAKGAGGSIYGSHDVNLKVYESTFTENVAKNAGALYLIGNTAVFVNDSSFQNNSAENGGALICSEGADVSIIGSNFLDNHAEYRGGAIFMYSKTASRRKLNNNTANKEEVSGYRHVQINVSESLFERNSAVNGRYFPFSFEACGGAISAKGNVSLVVSHSNFSSNAAYKFGGAISISDKSTSNISACKFISNDAN